MLDTSLQAVEGMCTGLRGELRAISSPRAPWVRALSETRALLFVALRELIVGAHEAELSTHFPQQEPTILTTARGDAFRIALLPTIDQDALEGHAMHREVGRANTGGCANETVGDAMTYSAPNERATRSSSLAVSFA